AGEGWMLMKELLQKEGLTEEKEEPLFKRKYILLIAGIAASVLLLIMITLPFQLNNKAQNAGISNNIVSEGQHQKSNKVRILLTEQLDAQQSLSRPVAKTKINLNASNIVLISKETNKKYLDSLVRMSLKKKQLLSSNEILLDDPLKIEGVKDS